LDFDALGAFAKPFSRTTSSCGCLFSVASSSPLISVFVRKDYNKLGYTSNCRRSHLAYTHARPLGCGLIARSASFLSDDT